MSSFWWTMVDDTVIALVELKTAEDDFNRVKDCDSKQELR